MEWIGILCIGVLCLAALVVAFIGTREDGYKDGYKDGHKTGYEEGYRASSKEDTEDNHTTQEMRDNYAGEYIENPEQLPNGCNVTVFQKGTEDWWEHGDICTRKDGTKYVNCWDGTYELNEVEVYL